ncbi:MAG: PDZ domain-containing protein [Vicinamibacteria bacterium]
MTRFVAAFWIWSALLSSEIVLDGVIVASNPADSVALVRRAESERAQILRVGETFQGYVLAEIARDSVRFEGGGGELRLFLEGSEIAVDRTRASPLPEDGDSVWIRRAFSREVARERFSKEIPVILSDTDLEPSVEEGEVRGLSVARLPDGTLLSESGLLPGDVLVSINGEPLRDVDSLWDLIARIVDQDEIRVVVRRRDQLLKLAYAFTK